MVWFILKILILTFIPSALAIHFLLAYEFAINTITGKMTLKQGFIFFTLITFISIIKLQLAGIDGILVSVLILILLPLFKFIPSYRRGIIFLITVFILGTLVNFVGYNFLLNLVLHMKITKINVEFSYFLFSLLAFIVQLYYEKYRN